MNAPADDDGVAISGAGCVALPLLIISTAAGFIILGVMTFLAIAWAYPGIFIGAWLWTVLGVVFTGAGLVGLARVIQEPDAQEPDPRADA